jgi:hypothetical protein
LYPKSVSPFTFWHLVYQLSSKKQHAPHNFSTGTSTVWNARSHPVEPLPGRFKFSFNLNDPLKTAVRRGCYFLHGQSCWPVRREARDDMDILGEEGERRDAQRQTGLKSGFALSHDGTKRDACVITNMSHSGALLLVEQPRDIDQQLVLLIDGEKQRRAARVVWRTEAAVAVSFLTADQDDSADGWVFAPAEARSA